MTALTILDPEKASSSADLIQDGDPSAPELEQDAEAEINEYGLEADLDVPSPRTAGVPVGRFATLESVIFVRPGLPHWLVWLKDVFFAVHDRHTDVPNYRTTPLISGALIPFSILLEIPGITEEWYVRTSGPIVIERRRNSVFLNTVLAISLACACVANIALLVRFFERRVAAMTVLAVVFLSIHDIINTLVVVIFGVQHRFNDGFTYGEAYWLTTCSTIVSLVTNATLLWDLIRTPNFAKSGSGLTRKQRSLIIINIIYLTYAALGALIFSLMMKLTFIDGLYFTIVTTLTIGFGDIKANNGTQRSVVCVYAAFGIVILGAAVRFIGETVIEGLEIGYRLRVREYRRLRRERHRYAREAARWRNACEARLIAKGAPIWVPAETQLADASDLSAKVEAVADLIHSHNESPDSSPRPPVPPRPGMVLNVSALEPAELAAAARTARVALDRFAPNALGRMHSTTSQMTSRTGKGVGPRSSRWWAHIYHKLLMARGIEAQADDSSSRRNRIGTVKALELEERRSLYLKLGLAWLNFLMFWTVGSVIFWHVEQWPYSTAMYFCFVTFTTIGYGDVVPLTALGRSIFVFWALLGVGSMTVLIAVISDAFSSKYRSVMHSKTFDRAVKQYRRGHSLHEAETVQLSGKDKSSPSNRPLNNGLSPELKANLDKLSEPKSRPPRLERPTIQISLPPVDENQPASADTTKPGTSNTANNLHPHWKSNKPETPTSHPAMPSPVPSKRSAAHVELTGRMRARFEALPMTILEEAHGLRQQMRYFLVANGHTHGWDDAPPVSENAVPTSLRILLDEIAHDAIEDGSPFGSRVREEIWDDSYARNTLFVLGFEKSLRRLVDSAEGALEVLAERDRLLSEQDQRMRAQGPVSRTQSQSSEVTKADHDASGGVAKTTA